MTLNFDIYLTKNQQEAYDLIKNPKYKYITLCWSRQQGKSCLLKILCIEWLFTSVKEKIAYICPSYILAKKLYQDIVQSIPQKYITKANASDFTIEVRGNTLTFYSAESSSRLRGLSIHRTLVDEAAFVNWESSNGEHLWNNILMPATKAVGKKIIFVSTPNGKSNFFYECFLKGESTRYPKWVSMKRDIYSDELITSEEIQEIKESIPSIAFQQEFECAWLDDSGSFFTNYSDLFTDKSFDTNSPCYCGIDVSSTGEDHTVVTFINDKNQCIQYTVEGTIDMKYNRTAQIINNHPNLKLCYIESNSIGSLFFNEVLKLVRNKHVLKDFTTTNSTKIQQAGLVQVMFDKKEISFQENNKELKNELSNFSYNYTRTGKVQLCASIGHDDNVMSLCLATQAMNDKKKIGTYSFHF